MIVTTIEQQRLIAKVVRKVGGYSNLAKLEAKRRYCKKHKLEFHLKEEIAKLKSSCAA